MRLQSASSMNLFKQCPRKYYYRYIEKLPEPPSIHCVRGNIVHSVLEHFFDLDTTRSVDYEKVIRTELDNLLDKFWIQYKPKLKELEMRMEDLNGFYVDSRDMLANWADRFVKQVRKLVNEGMSFAQAVKELSPAAEEYLKDVELSVQGYVDAIYYDKNGDIRVVDYKTSRKDIITPEYSLQAGLYAVLIEKVKGKRPLTVSFDFLKGEMRDIPVDDSLIKDTLFEIEQIHVNTESTDRIDYMQKPSGLCKWSNERGSGQCAYYDVCKPMGR